MTMKNLALNIFYAILLAALGRPESIEAADWMLQEPEQEKSLAPVFGQGADLAWRVTTGKYAVDFDAALGKYVLTADSSALLLDGQTNYLGDKVMRALVRMRTDAAHHVSAGFSLARKDANDPGIRMGLGAVRNSEYIGSSVDHGGKPLHDLAALSTKLDWAAPNANGFTYYLKAYERIEPGWPEDYRAHIEADMASVQGHNHKWLEARIELRKGEARFWLDGRLVGIKKDASINPDGSVRMDLSPGVQLADWRMERLGEASKGFEPLALGGYANARTFLDGESVKTISLPPADMIVKVEGIPFIFPGVNTEGNDHIDVGRSFYRQANQEGYFQSYLQRWAGSSYRDPARIQLRLPNAPYDTLYLIAASDDERDSVPLLTAQFFRPAAGFAENFEAAVPLATAKSSNCKPLPVTLSGGKKVNLWLVKIPLDPGRLSSLADLDIVEIELTKKVRQYRSYPDPYIYGWHGAGQPSAVHVYAVTLAQAPVGFTFMPDPFGHVWTAPAVPSYLAAFTNHTAADLAGKLTVVTRSYDGTETTQQEQPVTLAKGAANGLRLQVPVKLNGYHDITATLEIAGKTWTEKRSFVRLAPDTRSTRWEEGKGALFGYWSYHGGHYTPKPEHHINLMTMAGARTSISWGEAARDHPLVKKHWSRVPCGAWEVSPQPWAAEDPYDPKKYAEYQEAVIKLYTAAREAVPEEFRPDHVFFYPEPHVSSRITEGHPHDYWGEPNVELTADEKARVRMFFVTAKCAAEAIRKTWPKLKIHIPWGDPLFIVPLLRAGFPKELIDGSGLDLCHFERLPEQQLHQISLHRLYILRKEYERAGIPNPSLQYCEGIFVPTEVGAASWQQQMDYHVRWVLLSMAYGVQRFYSGWFGFDCGNYYGSEHYGGCGIQRRIPYCDPKPAYAAFATITDQLNQANFDGWLKTGSLTTYCLRFKGPKSFVYTLWTLRGHRPVTLTLAADADVNVTDSMNNTNVIKSQGNKLTLLTAASAVFLTGAEIVSVEVGSPDHSDVKPVDGLVAMADLGDGSWNFTDKRDHLYETNNLDTSRYQGRFSASLEKDAAQGQVLVSKLEKQDKVHELMPWYRALAPKKPITLPYAGAALGLWVKGASDWGRFVYCLRDAKGERWISIGTKDQYNCDDMHSWSAFCFDGWRYLRFELPGHIGYDNFRRHGTTWWRYQGGDGIVDLPLVLENLIIEQRSHILYVNDIQPAASSTVLFGKLFIEYASPEDATPEAGRLSRLRMPLPKAIPELPNPIVEMERDGVATPAVITKLVPPEHEYDGTRVHVHFQEIPAAKKHFVWVAAYPDGRGAVNLTPNGLKSGALVYGLRPGVHFTFWLTYQDADGKMSKPSKPVTETLVDMFKEK